MIQVRTSHQRLAFQLLTMAHTNKFYAFQQCTYIVLYTTYHALVPTVSNPSQPLSMLYLIDGIK